MKSKKNIIMICTGARGGMSAVIDGYKTGGIFNKFNIVLLTSHNEGSVAKRLNIALMCLWQYLILLAHREVAVVHCHSAPYGSFWRKSVFAVLAHIVGVPVIFHLHGGEMQKFVEKQPKVLKILICFLLKKCSLVIVLSNGWKNYIKSISPQTNTVVLPNCIDIPDISSDRTSHSAGNIELLFLGVIKAPKGVYDLITSLKAAHMDNPRLRLTIAGNGEIETARDLVKRLELEEAVTFAGWVDSHMKTSLLQEADIFLLPSYHEGLPMSILEAMSYGIPVISTRIGGIPEVVRNGIEGILLNPGDINSLTKAIVDLGSDHELRIRMGVAARQRAMEEFSATVVFPNLENIYGQYTKQ